MNYLFPTQASMCSIIVLTKHSELVDMSSSPETSLKIRIQWYEVVSFLDLYDWISCYSEIIILWLPKTEYYANNSNEQNDYKKIILIIQRKTFFNFSLLKLLNAFDVYKTNSFCNYCSNLKQQQLKHFKVIIFQSINDLHNSFERPLKKLENFTLYINI